MHVGRANRTRCIGKTDWIQQEEKEEDDPDHLEMKSRKQRTVQT